MPAPTLPDLPSNGTRANVDKYNAAFQYLIGLLSQLDDDNVASLSGSKITDGTLPLSALSATARQGWLNGSFLPSPNTITYNGNRSYDLVFNSLDLTGILSKGMRVRANRTVSAPTQCTSLNGSSQYWVKSSPNKCTFTDDFVVTAYIKLSSYATAHIMSRFNGTSGWALRVNTDGTIELFGTNANVSNFSAVKSNQAVPLNKWVRVTAQLDMSSFTATPTTSYVMIDDVDVPATVLRGGTNPTALVQAGNLEVGSANGSGFFPGKIAQAAFFTAKVTQATMRSYTSQTFSGSETNLGSAYSFNNVVTDLNTTTPNDLSVGGGSAVATNADSPYGDGLGLTKEYGIIMDVAFSTNTTVNVHVPEGCAIPTSGGVGTLDYSTMGAPYGFPKSAAKWAVITLVLQQYQQSSPTASVWYNTGIQIALPTGSWDVSWEGDTFVVRNGVTDAEVYVTLSTGASSETDDRFTGRHRIAGASGNMEATVLMSRRNHITVSSQTQYYLNYFTPLGSTSVIGSAGTAAPVIIQAVNAYL